MRISDWSSDVCSSDLLESRDIGALHIVDIAIALIAIGQAAPVDTIHDILQHLLQFALAPRAAAAVLAHLQPRHRDAAGIRRLARREHDLRLLEDMHAVEGGRTEERRLGTEGVRTCRSRWSPDN